jgi:NADPH:quinone reductase-like Zn-dependent oxidoreductase
MMLTLRSIILTRSVCFMTYRNVVATRLGGPEVLQVTENELRLPTADEVRIRVQAAAVCRPDITVRSGHALYSGTPLGQKPPFVPGYAVIGVVDAIGEKVSKASPGDRVGVLSVTGGYTEVLYWRSDRLIPVPDDLDAGEAVTLILNYIVAYQTMFRSVKAQAGETALIIGASGGIGTALLQLGGLAGLRLYGIASAEKQDVVKEAGAAPIDYRSADFVDFLRQAEPDGIDVVFDGVTSLKTIQGGLSLLRRGGRQVSFGEPAGFGILGRMLGTMLSTNLRGNGKRYSLYGTSTYFLFNRQPYLDDWATLFSLLGERKIEPVIAARFPITEAAAANVLLESGQVVGNVVLVAD